jgi:hypothetical protein
VLGSRPLDRAAPRSRPGSTFHDRRRLDGAGKIVVGGRVTVPGTAVGPERLIMDGRISKIVVSGPVAVLGTVGGSGLSIMTSGFGALPALSRVG